jgi:hypothetical protein
MTMSLEQLISKCGDQRLGLDGKLAAYLAAAGAVGSVLASEAQAVIVSNNSVHSVGVNGAYAIDFNGDTQTDFEIDHDQVNLGGGNLVNYLQVDKNDSTGAGPGENPLAIPGIFDTFATNGNPANDTAAAKYVTPTNTLGDYPAALTAGTPIGPASFLDFQEGNGFGPNTNIIRANRLIDGDAGKVDNILGGTALADISIPTNGPNFVGLGGQTRYVGVQMNLQSAGQYTYGWIGIKVTSDSLATADVVGWGYQTDGSPISAGAPEPSSILTALVGGVMLLGGVLWRRVFRR